LFLVIALAVNLLFAGWSTWAVANKGNDCGPAWRAASPYYSVNPSTAPAAIYNSAEEMIPKAQADLYARTLRRAGIAADETIIPGTKHAEAYADHVLPNGKTVWQDTAAFIKAHE
jgi:acetyl esterase/lipase